MTIFQFLVTYAVCWWLVLFMVLPHQAAAPQNPAPGHAPSAPANPQLKRKCRWATLWAFLPAIAMYFIATYAHADDEIYHVGGGCEELSTYRTPDDVSTKDGQGVGNKKVAPANLDGPTVLGDMDHIRIPLEIPTAKYLDPQAPGSATTSGAPPATANASNHNVDLSQSFAQMGTIEINKDQALLNGQPIGGQAVRPAGCDHPVK